MLDGPPLFTHGLVKQQEPDLSPETPIRLKDHDVDRDLIRRAKSQGH